MTPGKSHFWQVLVLLCCVHSGTANSLELTSKVNNGQLAATLQNISYPDRFVDKELDSGLPNHVSILVSLSAQGQQRAIANLNYQVTYDLWDEVYTVQVTNTRGQTQNKVFDNKMALTAFLTTIKIPSLGNTTELGDQQTYQLNARVIVNPIKPQRIKKIQAWIASSNGFTAKAKNATKDGKQNTALMRSSVRGEGKSIPSPIIGGVTSSGPRFQKLFDQILTQYMSDGEVPALWRSDLVTLTVDIKQLTHEN